MGPERESAVVSLIDWRTSRDALKVASDAIGFDFNALERGLISKLESAGAAYDHAFSSDPTTVLTEDPSHVTWRTVTAPTYLERLDKIAMYADGGPATTIDPAHIQDAIATITGRLKAASNLGGISAEKRALAADALNSYRLPEPQFFVRRGYKSVASVGKPSRLFYGVLITDYDNAGPPTLADIETALVAALAEVDAYLAATP